MTALRIDIETRLGDFTLQCALETSAPVTGLFGPSGAGKTSLLHAIAGLIRPARGTIDVGGRRLLDHAARLDTPVHRRGIGVVFQEPRLFPHRSVRGNLRYGLRAGADFDHVVRILELAPLLNRRTRGLSGGESRRVALGRSLLAGPDLLLLDEPLAGLDQRLRSRIIELLRRVRDELCVPMIIVSHDLQDMLRLTDELIILSAGRVADRGPYRELCRRHAALAVIHEAGLMNVLTLEAGDGERLITGAGGARLLVSGPPAGEPGDVAVRPQDIALAPARLEAVSIQNQIPGRVAALTSHDDRVIVEVDIGVPLLVEVTPRAVDQLELAPGRDVWSLIKSSAVRRL